MKAYIFIADGFEETEAIAPIDLLRRAGCDAVTVAVGRKADKISVSAHNIPIVCDVHESEITGDFDMVILPGGAAGVANLEASDTVKTAIMSAYTCGKYIGAICAAPGILGKMGIVSGKRVTCYPGWEKYLPDSIYTAEDVTADGIFITGRGAGKSLQFGLELIKLLYGSVKSDEIAKAIQYK